MKINSFILSTSLLSLLGVSTSGQTSGISISGKIDTAITNYYCNNEITIKLNKTANYLDQSELINIPVNSDGSFKSIIKSPNNFLYISFWMLNKNKKIESMQQLLPIYFPARPISMLQEVYLFERGDNIEVEIWKSGNLRFKGRGSEKLNCQFQIYSIDYIPPGIRARLASLSGDDGITLKDSLLSLTKKLKLEILKSYKPDLSSRLYDLLFIDITASTEYQIFSGMPALCTKPPIEINTKAAQKYYRKNVKRNYYQEIDADVLETSAFYADMIFQKEFCSTRLFSEKGDYIRGDSFKAIYEKIKINYNGKLRDKLLIISFQQMNEYYPSETRLFIHDALKIIQDSTYRVMFKDWSSKQFSAYPFKMADTKGNIHRLSDYIGKVLVIDFWFTGCTWCAYLNAAMRTIIDKYQANKNVIFITVSLDKDKNRWRKSVSTNIYTSPETINLYTNGLGDRDLAYSYYNFVGAPQQLIIGKNGNIISSHPPRPGTNYSKPISDIYQRDYKTGVFKPNPEATLSNLGTKEFMLLIDKALLEY